MQQKGKLPKIQHYVPKFLLRNFVKAGTQQVWVCDKQNDNIFSTNIKNIAAEKGFYNFGKSEDVQSLEQDLATLETKISELLKKIISEKSIKWLSSEDRGWISVFVVIQQQRTLHQRESLLHFDGVLRAKLKDMGIAPEEVENYNPLDEDSVRQLSMGLLLAMGKQFPLISEKKWVLLRTKRTNPFYISDNPISLQNTKGLPGRGSIGLAVKGIEIYLPLSSTLTLAMYCPSIVEEMQDGFEKCERLSVDMPKSEEEFYSKLARLEKFKDGFVEGVPVDCSDEMILNLNYLQVRYAERQVYCEKNSFQLVQDMLKKNSVYKFGPRMTMG